MRTVTVEIDRNEQNPLLFPQQIVFTRAPFQREFIKIQTKRVVLPFGDYRLSHRPKGVVIERKAGLNELCKNLIGNDRGRFNNAWERFLQGCHYPCLMIEQSLATDVAQYGGPNIRSEDVYHELYSLLFGAHRPYFVMWAGRTTTVSARMKLGGEMVRLMLSAPIVRKPDGIQRSNPQSLLSSGADVRNRALQLPRVHGGQPPSPQQGVRRDQPGGN